MGMFELPQWKKELNERENISPFYEPQKITSKQEKYTSNTTHIFKFRCKGVHVFDLSYFVEDTLSSISILPPLGFSRRGNGGLG